MLLITGMPGAGKEEVIRILMEKGYEVRRMGDVVREAAAEAGIEPDMIGDFSTKQREKYGPYVWAERTAKRVNDPENTVIDGVRSLAEVEIFRKKGDVVIIGVHASPKTRHERLMKRARGDESDSIEKIKRREERELSWGLGNVIAMSDHMIINEGTIEELRESVESLLFRL